MENNPTIIIISDYGIGDPAFTEVMLRLHFNLPHAYVLPQSTPSFSTINTGFWIYQLATSEHKPNTYIFSNTAPRKEDPKAQENNKGEKLMYAQLENGFELLAVNAGYAFSFVKPLISHFYEVNVSNEGSQFRSRDNYPHIVKRMVEHDTSFLGTKGDVSLIPDVPDNKIASIDGYGNMKTTMRKSEVDFENGARLQITLQNTTHEAIYTDGVFNLDEGKLAFAPGSSGHKDPFMELFIRGKSAWEAFGKPDVEADFSLMQA